MFHIRNSDNFCEQVHQPRWVKHHDFRFTVRDDYTLVTKKRDDSFNVDHIARLSNSMTILNWNVLLPYLSAHRPELSLTEAIGQASLLGISKWTCRVHKASSGAFVSLYHLYHVACCRSRKFLGIHRGILSQVGYLELSSLLR